MERNLLGLSGILGFLAVALGAFGAHGLKRSIATLEDGAQRMAWWETAAHYHLVHALAIAIVAIVVGRGGASTWAGYCFAGGILLFSGSLYVMTLTGVRVLGAVTPFGGVLFLAGWAQLAWTAFKLPS